VRVLSLLPAATDAVVALGRADRLVGVTHECDAPGSERLPRVTSSAVDAQREAGTVDAAVRALSAEGAAIFALDERRIAGLRPDVILTQRLCDVCAVSEADVRALARRIGGVREIVTLGATTLDGVWDDVRAIARALGADDAGEPAIADAQARMRRVHETLRAARAPRPRVAVIEWGDPIYAAGHWVPEMVRRAGGVDVLARPGEHSATRTVEQVVGSDPEVVLVAPCGYDAARAEREARRLLASDAWAWARGRRVWAVDANRLVSRPGPLLADGVAAMAAILAPDLFAAPDPATARRVA
jgi:iron complex transport system substrate-binding protein